MNALTKVLLCFASLILIYGCLFEEDKKEDGGKDRDTIPATKKNPCREYFPRGYLPLHSHGTNIFTP